MTSVIENSAILRPLEAMEAVGFDVARVGTDEEGRLRMEDFAAALDNTVPGFATVMWANNESGVIQPVAEVCALGAR